MIARARPRRSFCSLLCSVGAAAAVEFGIIMPLILVPLTAGFVEVGRAVQHHHVLVKSVRDAARFLARVPEDDYPAGMLGASVCDDDTGIAGQAKDLARYGKFNPGAGDALLISYWTSADSICIQGPTTRAITLPDTSTTDTEFVQMTVTLDYDDFGLLSLLDLDGAITFTVAHEERHIGE